MDDNVEWMNIGDEPVDTLVEETMVDCGAIDDSIVRKHLSCWGLAAISRSDWFDNDDLVNVGADSDDTAGENWADSTSEEIVDIEGSFSVIGEEIKLFDTTDGHDITDPKLFNPDFNSGWCKREDELVDTQVAETGATDNSAKLDDNVGLRFFKDSVNAGINSVNSVNETLSDLIGEGMIDLEDNFSVDPENKILFWATEDTDVEGSETMDRWVTADAKPSNADNNFVWFKSGDELANIQVVVTTGAADDSVIIEDLICSHILDGMVGIDSICTGFNDFAGTVNVNWVDSTDDEILDLETNNSIDAEDEESVATEETDSEVIHRLDVAGAELLIADENVGWIKCRDESVDTQVADTVGETEDLSHVCSTLDDIDSIDKEDDSVVNDTVGTDENPVDSICEELVSVGGNFLICA